VICNPDEIIIQGITRANKTFRPSDWGDRLCGILSTFGHDQKLVYAAYVRPVLINGTRCVAVNRHLKERDPVTFNYIMTFAKDNDLMVEDCLAMVAGQKTVS
jgi:hypothetical protein